MKRAGSGEEMKRDYRGTKFHNNLLEKHKYLRKREFSDRKKHHKNDTMDCNRLIIKQTDDKMSPIMHFFIVL